MTDVIATFKYILLLAAIVTGQAASAQQKSRPVVDNNRDFSYTDSIFNSEDIAVVSHNNVLVGQLCCVDMNAPIVPDSFCFLKLADMRHCCSWVDFTRKHGTDALFRITLGDFWT